MLHNFLKSISVSGFIFAATISFGLLPAQSAPLKIGYSDWPGWVAWDIGVQKGWFKEEGVDVDFVWFEYAPSMDAFSAGKVDAVAVTNGDEIVMGSSGAKSTAILLNDYSNGNDMIVAKPGIKKLSQLKGKKIAVELGLVDHLLLLKALQSKGMSASDVEMVNTPTDQTAQALSGGKVDAIAAWQPNSGQALKSLPGSKAIYTSADAPGLIYDVLAVNPKSLAENKEAWKKVIKVWFRIAAYVKDPKNLAEASKIMSARVGLKPEEYAALMKGTFFLDKKGNLAHYKKGKDLTSLYYSGMVVDTFNVANKVYKASEDVGSYLDPSLMMEAAK